MRIVKFYVLFCLMPVLHACDSGGSGCSRYSSQFSCEYVEKKAEYYVWYWRRLEQKDERDNFMIGKAIGLHMCEFNARRYAAIIEEPFRHRAYICGLMKDERLIEKHRFLSQ